MVNVMRIVSSVQVAHDVCEPTLADKKSFFSPRIEMLYSRKKEIAFSAPKTPLLQQVRVQPERHHEAELAAGLVAAASVPKSLVASVPTKTPIAATIHDIAKAQSISGKKIDTDVLGVLKQCNLVGNQVFLPSGTLDRKLYKKVNEVLVALGGKWKGGKVKAHVFEDDPSAMFDIAIMTGEFIRPQDFGYFPTPDDLVRRALEMAEIEPGMRLLEPSAGRGAFALPMLKAAQVPGNVTACEILPSNAKWLKAGGVDDVRIGDFLAMEPEPVFDRVIMNPPFNGGVDVDHVLHAAKFLSPTGRLVAITSVGWTFNSSRKAENFRDFMGDIDAVMTDVPAGAFKESGTNVPTKIIQIEAENLPWYRDEPVEH